MCVQQKLQKNRNQLQDIDLYIFCENEPCANHMKKRQN